MVSFKNLSLLALASSAIAAPAPHRNRGNRGGKHIVWHTVVHTAYVTVGPGYPVATPPAEKTTTVVEPTPTPKPQEPSSVYVPPVEETPEPSPEPTPEPTPTPSPSEVYEEPVAPSPTEVYEEPAAPSPTVVHEEPTPSPEPEAPTNSGYMGIVDEWRGKLGLSKLAHDAKLEANALKTVQDGNGQMVHQLNSGSMGQVLAPGGPEDFYHVFVGGWLCERPTMAGMNGVCDTASEGWYYTSTGHADILTSGSYSKIGCACATGIWSCDLA